MALKVLLWIKLLLYIVDIGQDMVFDTHSVHFENDRKNSEFLGGGKGKI